MNFLEVTFSPVRTSEEMSLLIAELLDIGFDSFTEEENVILAYIPSELFTEELLSQCNFLSNHPEIQYNLLPLEDKNWNKEWEANYQPVTIAEKCHVRAPFHPPLKDMEYEIVIEPKMAFGTAHHETTRLMAEWLMELDVRGRHVLDMGCGTGVLAILANKMGCGSVLGIDNDEWAWRNGMENFRINGLDPENVLLGDASIIKPGAFDMILANINRNVLLQDMKAYVNGLCPGGTLLLSGFYAKDIETIRASASEFGLHLSGFRTLDDWAVVHFVK